MVDIPVVVKVVYFLVCYSFIGCESFIKEITLATARKMAISFEKHRTEIEGAWKDVLDDKSSTDWYVLHSQEICISISDERHLLVFFYL